MPSLRPVAVGTHAAVASCLGLRRSPSMSLRIRLPFSRSAALGFEVGGKLKPECIECKSLVVARAA